MKYRYSFFIFFFGFVIQTTIANYFSIFHAVPNFILCLVIIFSFLYEGYHGMIYGMIFGLVTDICFAQIIGIAAMSYLIVALLCLELKHYLYKDSIISVLIVTLTGTVAYPLFYWSVTKLLGDAVVFSTVAKIGAVQLIYHSVITWILYLIFSRNVIKHRSDRYIYRGSLQEARSLYKK